jgi:hypothetical protein
MNSQTPDTPAVAIQVPLSFDFQVIADLMTTAFEGGSNYWCSRARARTEDMAAVTQGPWYSDRKFWSQPDFLVTLTDAEDEDEKPTFGPADIKAGLEILARDYPHHFADILKDNADADTGDAFLQCCALKEIVYG